MENIDQSKASNASRGDGAENATAAVVQQFIAAFQNRDPAAIPKLVAPNCVMESMQPAPEGQRIEGYEANVRFWQAMVADPNGSFEVEDLVVCGERAINRWRYRFGEGEANSVRGVTLLWVQDGKIVEALGYAKTQPRTDLGQDLSARPSELTRTTAEVIRRYNDAFQQHDPSLLSAIIAEDCIIENTNPAPNGARHVGREACLTLWTKIATSPRTHFDIEDVVVADERATIRWRLHWGTAEGDSVRGVNLMRVRDGQIVEALGYVKGS
jgi:ketosteroid isomerase-like protein